MTDDLDPRTTEGADEVDITPSNTEDASVPGDSGAIGMDNAATTADGGVAVDGGKLPGNVDDFEGELEARRLRVEPGADPENAVSPGQHMVKGNTKGLGI